MDGKWGRRMPEAYHVFNRGLAEGLPVDRMDI